jgi:predicted transcriptional regulator
MLLPGLQREWDRVMGIESYLQENVDSNVTIKPWYEKNKLPVFLRNNYNFHEMTVLGSPCILMEKADEMPGVVALQKHIKRVETVTNRQVVLFYKEISRYRRKSLIENRIPFVVEDGQMYLPFLALDLKKAAEHVENEVKHFTVSGQTAYLYFLYHKNEVVNMTEFAEKMECTKMTASRALNELYNANLITYEIGGKTGRSKEYKRLPDPEYFRKGRRYLKSPVKKIVFLETEPLAALTAGLDALAKLSMINPPAHPVIAIGREQFNTQKIEVIKNKDVIKDTQLMEVQIWDYDPRQFSRTKYVDPLSLYASLKDENDERIEHALEEVLQAEPWYTD